MTWQLNFFLPPPPYWLLPSLSLLPGLVTLRAINVNFFLLPIIASLHQNLKKENTDFTSVLHAGSELYIAQLEYSLESKGITSQKEKIYSCSTVIASWDFKTGLGYYPKIVIQEPFLRIKKGNIE